MGVEILDPDLRPLKQKRPGEVFEPNSWAQDRFLLSETPELLYSGHRGSSKSRTICEKADFLCRKFPGARIVLSRKKREHMGKTTLATLLTEVILPSHRDWGWNPSADGGSTLYYPNGSEVLCAGLDNPGRMLSGEFMANYSDQGEELDEDEFVAIGGSLRQQTDAYGRAIPFHQLGLACNPDGPGHFLYRRFRPDLARHGANYITINPDPTPLLDGRSLPAGRAIREVIIAGLADNLSNLPDGYQAWLASLPGRYRDRYVLGLWIAFEGYIYDNFNPTIHVLRRDDPKIASWREWGGYPPPSWKRYRGVDFGYTNPFVFQWWARSPEGVWYLYREVYYSHRMVREHRETIRFHEARELATLNEAIERKNERERLIPAVPTLRRLSFSNTVADHEDAEARAQLDFLGIATNAAVKDVEPGIQTVYELLQPKTDPTTNEVRCRMYLVEGACVETDPHLVAEGKPTCTAEEFPLYQRQGRKATSKDKSAPEDPRKGDDHGLDTARYVVHSSRVSGEVRVVRLVGPDKVRNRLDW